MVNKKSIGIIGIQGAISEHVFSMEKTIKKLNFNAEVLILRVPSQIDGIDGLIIPGGESTTISNILYKSGMHEIILNKIKKRNLSIMGTCAGCVILAKKLSNDTNDVKLLSAMDIKVKRNAFGRQKESFEYKINIEGFKDQYNAIFIRAPVIEDVWGNCKILAKIKNKIVMARQNNFLAISFHPELTNDFRVQQYFLNMI
jgi:pyridoxal 5'-phosphate synthase pdxT subunit